MDFSRLPRFERSSAVAHFEVTDRDRTIIALVRRHQFLRSSHILSLIGSSQQQILRRLKLLYHHGYMERPRAQLDYYHQGGSREIVYGLGDEAACLIDQEPDSGIGTKWNDKSRSIGRIFLEHALLVSDVMVALELACRASPHTRLIHYDELARELAQNGKASHLRWKVNLRDGTKLGVVPDRVLALEFPNQIGSLERAYFFLEADRGTMPVIRKALSQTSMYRKFLAYEATWGQLIHQKRFGFHRFRVLTVTTNLARLKSLTDACSKLERGHGLFLFTDRGALANLTEISAPIWKTYDGGSAKALS